MISIKKYKIFILMFLLFYNSKSQENKFFTQEQELLKFGEIILNGENDSIRYEANNIFQKILIDLLSTKKSYKYKFGETAPLSILTPKNKKFKFFSWFVPLKNGNYDYYGLIQTRKKNKKKHKLYYLETIEKLNRQNQNNEIQYDNWYGCFYYDIITIKIKNKTYYTLLGWDGNDNYTTKKIVDVLKLEKKQEPIFGANIFNNNQKRIILEYSNKYSMSLSYDNDLDYIVYDHLEPIDGISINNFKIYAPNLSYDVLKKTELGWQLETNIYLNNTK
tara:strand:- start:182 stop:1009 length:828 start_codon:yes stop_codon:yes gene_type:complete